MFRALLLTLAAAGLSVAAPVPKAAPAPAPNESARFTLGTATSDGKVVKISFTANTTTVFNGNGAPPPLVRPAERTISYQLAQVKVTTAHGKELTGEDLERALSTAVPAVLSTAAFDDEWRKLFADDVLFVELVRGGAVAPGVNPLPGGAVIRPLPIRRAVLPVIPPVEEKK